MIKPRSVLLTLALLLAAAAGATLLVRGTPFARPTASEARQASPVGSADVDDAAVEIPAAAVKNLFLSRGCVSCHDLTNPLVGPSFTAIAARYEDTPETVELLLTRVRQGSSGVWGALAMPAQPEIRLDDEEARAMVRWILALDDEPLADQD